MPKGREISSSFPSRIQPKSARSSEMRHQFAAKISAFESAENRKPISKVKREVVTLRHNVKEFLLYGERLSLIRKS